MAWALVNGQFTQENGEGAVSIMKSMLAIQQTTESFDDIVAMVEAHKAQYSAVTKGQELDARLVEAIYRTKLAPEYEKALENIDIMEERGGKMDADEIIVYIRKWESKRGNRNKLKEIRRKRTEE